MISAGHARALLGISDETLQENTAMKVFDEKLSVRDTERLVKNLASPAKKTKKREIQRKMPFMRAWKKK